jgi:hypothetical protein
MPSDMLFMYDKRRTEDSYRDKYQGSEEIMPANSGFDNAKKISVSPHYRKPWQRKWPKKYPQTKQKEDPGLTSSNNFLSDTVQRIQRPANGPEIVDVRTDQRIRKASSPDTYSLKAQQNSPKHHRITYKQEGNSPNSWKPIRGHKMTDSFKSRYKMTTSNPLRSGEDTPTYKDKRQDSDEEEVSYGYKHVFGGDSGDDDEDYDDIDNDYASKIQKTLKSDGNNIGLQEIYQQKDDSLHSYLNHVPYPAKIKDDTRSYEHERSYRSSENETEDNERIQNIIQSRIDHLKESTKREMANNFYSEQNARAPTHSNIANDRIKWVQF